MLRNKIRAALALATGLGLAALQDFSAMRPTAPRPTKKPRPMTMADHEAMSKAQHKRAKRAQRSRK